MSIAARIRQLVEDEALESVKPEFLDPEDAPRDLYVTPEVAELFEEVDETDARGKIREVAAAVMRGFVDGDYVTLALSPFDKAATAIMARTDKVEFGIVDFRCLDPEPGLRVCFVLSQSKMSASRLRGIIERISRGTVTGRRKSPMRKRGGHSCLES